MTVPANEPEPQGHPAWTELLNEVPEDLRPVITPKLEEWERNLQQKLQGEAEKYKPFEAYQPLVENNVPLDTIQQALFLAQQLEENPQGVIQGAIEHYGLEGFGANQTPSGNDDYDDEDYDDNGGLDLSGLENHPAYQQLKQQADQLQEYLDEQRRTKEEEQNSTQLRSELQALHDKYDIEAPNGAKIPGFDDLYVTALMSQGVDPEQAINHFNETFNARMNHYTQAQNPTQQAPVVMGGDGSTGSGVPNEPVKMGDLKGNDIHDMVAQIINADKNQ